MHRRQVLALCAALTAAALLLPGPALARTPARFSHPQIHAKPHLSRIPSLARTNMRGQYFVMLSAQPVTSYQAAALGASGDGIGLSEAEKAAARIGILVQQRQARPQVTAAGARIEATFTDVLNGFRVSATPAQVSKIARLSGVTRVYRVPEAFRSDLASADYIRASQIWNATGFTGGGVKIAVIDSGINYDHRNFAGAGNPTWNHNDPTIIEPGSFPTAKVVAGYDFVGDDYDPDSDDPSAQQPTPDPDPLDCKSSDSGNVQHGSHVAGIAAGTGVTSDGKTYTGAYTQSAIGATDFRIGPGIAPQAKLMAYRVLSCDGGTFVVLDAIERAVRDGADVINMSLGSPLGNPDAIDSVASNNAAVAGVTVVTSTGNSGPTPYLAGSPGAASRVISVGAMDASVFLSDGAIIDFATSPDVGGWNMYETALPVSGPMRVITDGSDLSDGCVAEDFDAVQAGDIVAIVRGNCDFAAKRGFAQEAGAAGVVLVNNIGETVVNPVPDPDHTIPVISVNPSNTDAVMAGDGEATMLKVGDVPNEHLGDVANFSSGGPRRFDDMPKPDVSAPGVDVFSTNGATVNQGKSLSGTSMSSPNVAGAAALILQAHPSWGPAHVKGALVGTASPGKVNPYTLRISGSGVVDVPKALKTLSWAQSNDDPGTSSLTFGYQELRQNSSGSPSFAGTKSFRLTNDSSAPITYDLTNQLNTDALGLVASFPSQVTVPAKGSLNVNVTLTMDQSTVADLPDAAPFDAPVLEGCDAQVLCLPLTHVAGAIVATPTTGGTGYTAIRVPWLITPRGTSDIRTTTRGAYSGGAVKTFKQNVNNRGLHGGNVDVFAWGLTDQAEGNGSIDLRAAGVQALPTEVCTGTPDPSDRCLVFAVNTWTRWSSAAENEYDILIDTNHDGDADFELASVDGNVIFGPGTAAGVPVVAVIDLSGPALVDFWFATGPSNGSTLLMPVLASEIGRASGSPSFAYWAQALKYADDSGGPANPVLDEDLMLTGNDPTSASLVAKFNAFDNPISNGDFVHLDGREGGSVMLSVDTNRYKPTKKSQKGWLLANLEDPNGAPQADLVPVGPLP